MVSAFIYLTKDVLSHKSRVYWQGSSLKEKDNYSLIKKGYDNKRI